ncbi:hypothetical protein EVAR_100980_1 [Eumeta japonica]|uniref:Uncharacterized protein n=1 Tax=Eumeta variegata TaxID=151549 RepID=A0A4C1SVY8_EUMVA|nr:hypothetical protein EVAR_100980_1 [Eumeta japonica]
MFSIGCAVFSWHFLCCNDDTRSVLVHIVAYVVSSLCSLVPQIPQIPRPRQQPQLKRARGKWRPLEDVEELQNDDQRSTTTASDEDGSATARSVHFMEQPGRPRRPGRRTASPSLPLGETSDAERLPIGITKHTDRVVCHRSVVADTLITAHSGICHASAETNSAVQQLFNSGRPPPPAIEPQLITSETLKAWDAGARPRSDEMAVRRVAERNALRCSLLRVKPVKETAEEKRPLRGSKQKNVEKPNIPRIRATRKPSAAPAQLLVVLSTGAPLRHQPPDLEDNTEATKFLSTLAPLTACVGSAAITKASTMCPERPAPPRPPPTSTSTSATRAPDVVAARVGANDGDDSSGVREATAAHRPPAPATRKIRSRPVATTSDDYGMYILRDLEVSSILYIFIGVFPNLYFKPRRGLDAYVNILVPICLPGK